MSRIEAKDITTTHFTCKNHYDGESIEFSIPATFLKIIIEDNFQTEILTYTTELGNIIAAMRVNLEKGKFRYDFITNPE